MVWFWVLCGVFIGTSVYTFIYAKGWSYLTNDSSACANCHIMNEQYTGWIHSSHRYEISCNDCHTPPNMIGKWYTKMRNGFWHSYYFTVGGFHEPISISNASLKIVESACRNCHNNTVQMIDHEPRQSQELSCVRCHASVGHKH